MIMKKRPTARLRRITVLSVNNTVGRCAAPDRWRKIRVKKHKTAAPCLSLTDQPGTEQPLSGMKQKLSTAANKNKKPKPKSKPKQKEKNISKNKSKGIGININISRSRSININEKNKTPPPRITAAKKRKQKA